MEDDSLTVQIVAFLLQKPCYLGDIVLYWALLADYNEVKAYLEDSIRLAHKIGSSMRSGVPALKEVQGWNENRVRQEFISWAMEPVIDNGYAKGHELEKTGSFFEKRILPQSKFTDKRELTFRLTKLPPHEAVKVLSEVAISWVRNMNPESIRAAAIRNHRYLTTWQDKDLYYSVFYNFYGFIYEELMQGVFTDEVVARWLST